jgi:hypothetical protein
MVKRYNVSVSDEAAEKIDKWKHVFSPSEVFREAMLKKIEDKENFQKRIKEDGTMEEVIERLKREKEGSIEKFRNQGREEGARWAKAASYEKIVYLGNWEFDPDSGGAIFSDEVLGDYFQEAFKDHPTLKADLYSDGPYISELSELGDEWVLGWLEGALEVWDAIMEKI